MKKSFTLIELMVSVAIVGVLYSMAIPMYDKNLLKNRFETEAAIVLQSFKLAQEQYHIETGIYYTTTDGTFIHNEDVISSALKINLSHSNNFLYQIAPTENEQSYKIRAILRNEEWTTTCIDGDSSFICKQKNTLTQDEWVNAYSTTSIDNHYLELSYPNSSQTAINNIDYSNIYKNN